jgi:hypothetical protein
MKLAFRSGSKNDLHLAQTLLQATQWVKRPTSEFGSLSVEICMPRRRDGLQHDACGSDLSACRSRGRWYSLWEWL